LAVHPANQDLATSDAMQLARNVDPEGNRTLGVVSKLDLMDRGTNALEILNGQIIPLKLGYVGVVNRSQMDIAHNKAIQASINAEKEFFSTHPAYSIISQRCGSHYLAVKCNRV
jgi:dynamin 1-like protein